MLRSASLWSEISILLSTRSRMGLSSFAFMLGVNVSVSSLKLGGTVVHFLTCDMVACFRLYSWLLLIVVVVWI